MKYRGLPMSTSVYFGNIPGFYYVLKQTKPTTTVSSLYGERSTFLRNVEAGRGGGNIFRGWEVRIIAL